MRVLKERDVDKAKGICQHFITRVMKERVCESRHMSAVYNEISEREGP
jgi:hypothetical protein